MNKTQWIVFFIILTIIIVRGFIPNIFILDKYSFIMLFLLSIPLLAPYLKFAKLFGSEFTFKDNIDKLEKLVEETEKEEKDDELNNISLITFNSKRAIDLVKQDPNLALAALRMEIERVLKIAYDTVIDKSLSKTPTINNLISQLYEKDLIDDIQKDALQKIINLCNKAIHGINVTENEATKIINLATELSRSFSIGYSINFKPNYDFDEQGLMCEWEHCIEHMPIRREPDDRSCHIFGHDCPGGIGTSVKCKEDFNKNENVNLP